MNAGIRFARRKKLSCLYVYKMVFDTLFVPNLSSKYACGFSSERPRIADVSDNWRIIMSTSQSGGSHCTTRPTARGWSMSPSPTGRVTRTATPSSCNMSHQINHIKIDHINCRTRLYLASKRGKRSIRAWRNMQLACAVWRGKGAFHPWKRGATVF